MLGDGKNTICCTSRERERTFNTATNTLKMPKYFSPVKEALCSTVSGVVILFSQKLFCNFVDMGRKNHDKIPDPKQE